MLSAEDAWLSPFCHQRVRATKTLAVWTPPQHLVIHLKRFAAADPAPAPSVLRSSMPQAREKLRTSVRFPLRGLDLGPHVRGPTAGLVYDLYAVVNHYGGAAGGHYTACCLSPGDGLWRRFDDDEVETLHDPARDVVTPAAYLLFYRRRGYSRTIADLEVQSEV